MDTRELDRRFDHHAPDTLRAQRHQELRTAFKTVAKIIDLNCPGDSREKSLAMTNLEQSLFWGNAAVAREGR